jgi:hypothetical protein
MYSSASTMSHALEELVGHVDRLQRSLLLTHFLLEHGPISFIYRPSAPRASRYKIDAFIAKRGLLIQLLVRDRDTRRPGNCSRRVWTRRSREVSCGV